MADPRLERWNDIHSDFHPGQHNLDLDRCEPGRQGDAPGPRSPYTHIRYQVTDTAGPLHQLNEIEYFGDSGGTSKPTLSGRKVRKTNVTFEITDGNDTTLDGASVVVKIDAAVVPAVMSKTGKVTSYTHTPSTPYAFGSRASLRNHRQG